MLIYKTILSKKAKRDLIKISRYMKNYNYDKIVEKIYKDIENLQFMPRIHKTLISIRDKHGEYRRMVFENILLYIK